MRAGLAQLLKFGLVGCANTAITFLSFLLFTRILGWDVYLSNFLSYGLGLANSFIFNKLWTFGSRSLRVLEPFSFLAVFAACYLAQMACFHALLRARASRELAQLIAMLAYTGLNFAGNKLFTFRKGKGINGERS